MRKKKGHGKHTPVFLYKPVMRKIFNGSSVKKQKLEEEFVSYFERMKCLDFILHHDVLNLCFQYIYFPLWSWTDFEIIDYQKIGNFNFNENKRMHVDGISQASENEIYLVIYKQVFKINLLTNKSEKIYETDSKSLLFVDNAKPSHIFLYEIACSKFSLLPKELNWKASFTNWLGYFVRTQFSICLRRVFLDECSLYLIGDTNIEIISLIDPLKASAIQFDLNLNDDFSCDLALEPPSNKFFVYQYPILPPFNLDNHEIVV